jgi:hypothetical protein
MEHKKESTPKPRSVSNSPPPTSSTVEVSTFKQTVRAALQELFVSHESGEFISLVLSAAASITPKSTGKSADSKSSDPASPYLSPFHQFLVVKIMISDSLDKAESEDRKLVWDTILTLTKDGIISVGQISSALLVLYARLNDLILDVPAAIDFLKEFVRKFELLGYVDADTAETLYQQAEIYTDLPRAKNIKKKIEDLLREFLSSHALQDFAKQITDLGRPEFHHEVIKKAVSLACDMTDRERELVSQLISSLTGQDIKAVEVRKAFQMLVLSADDLKADIPHIVHLLSCFIARAVADEVLPPAFLSQQDLADQDAGALVIKQASALLKTNPASSRLERIWGFGGEFDSIANLKDSISEILSEYFVNSEVTEAIRSISELNTPYFYHEVVRRGFSLVLDKDKKGFSALVDLFVALHKQKVISSHQFQHGFQRIKAALPELSIDAPHAEKLYQTLKAEIEQKGLLQEEKTN